MKKSMTFMAFVLLCTATACSYSRINSDIERAQAPVVMDKHPDDNNKVFVNYTCDKGNVLAVFLVHYLLKSKRIIKHSRLIR